MIKAKKKPQLVVFNKRKVSKLDPETLLEKYGERDEIQDEQILLKRVILCYAIVHYPMVRCGMVWSVWYDYYSYRSEKNLVLLPLISKLWPF